MRRRDFMTLAGGMAIWPLAAHAQHIERMRRVSMLLGLEEQDPEAKTASRHFG